MDLTFPCIQGGCGARCTNDLQTRCKELESSLWCSKNRGVNYRKYKMSLSKYHSFCSGSFNNNIVIKNIEPPVMIKNPVYSGYCNRGFYLLLSNDQPVCFCPPSYYGDQCQFNSRRITLRIKLNRRHRTDVSAIVYILALLLCNNTIIIDHTHFIDSIQDSLKHESYLLYSRMKLNCIYTVQFEAFNNYKLLTVWKYNVSFDFLPSFRLAKILHFPNIDIRLPYVCSINTCRNNGTCYIINNNKILTFCYCTNGWYGQFCEQWDNDSYCSLENSIYRFKSLCICKEGYVSPNCYLKNTICESFPCLNNGTCYSYPNENNSYKCICPIGYDDARCQNQVPFLNIYTQSNTTYIGFFGKYINSSLQ
ncbi:unnamed protein product [Didymodactylos carnosus]|uniref:EGF-like domain-containing protein n=1 Tax=Didymodactylos carnosus TaxID=1234261 RepID=A0A816DN69_9BILA|nr:unnamed protein product [Didymodactylos carnosus]CAF4549688.1 unnamed protein product [Didymodactylos carnosus]